MAKPSMPLADCLRPFNQSDRHKVQPLINELRQAVGDDHLLGIQTELFEVLVKIVGNLPLSSGSGYFWPGSYIDFSLKLSSIALNLLRQRIQFFTMPLATSIVSSLNIFRNLSKSALQRALSEDTLRCFPNLSEEMSEVL